jgi:dTMP kinase
MTLLRFYDDPAPGVGVPGQAMPGRLIVVEGTDGVGRSTQIALLREWLEGHGYAVVSTGLRRSELAGAGLELAKQGNTLDHLTLNLFYATDFCDRLERQIIPSLRAGMVALVDRYVFSLIARAAVRGLPSQWLEDVYEFALVPDRVIYLDLNVEHLIPRVLASAGFDYWESGEDFLGGASLFENFVQYQNLVLAEFRRLADHHGFTVIDASRGVSEVFEALVSEIQDVIRDM